MQMKENRYWVFIEPTTYSCNNGDGWFLYNTKNGLHYSSSNEEIIAVLTEIYNPKDLGTILVDGDAIQQSVELSQFVQAIEQSHLGGIISVVDAKEKPIRLLPVLNLQMEIDRLKQGVISSTGRGVRKYLQELNIYVNGFCNQACNFCKDYHKQYLCCTKNMNANEFLSLVQLDRILKQVGSSNTIAINILGGDILLHPQIEQIASALQQVRSITRIWMHYANVRNVALFEGFLYSVTVTFPIDENCIYATIVKLEHHSVHYLFYITSEEDYAKGQEIIGNYPKIKYSILPFFNGENIEFFEKNVFVTEANILEDVIPLRKIFAHQKMNTNFFGMLTILPNGDVKGSINTKTIGDINDFTLFELIHAELIENTAWWQIRDSAPCNGCKLQFLCPSPSNLEMAIGKANLCCVI